MAIQAICIVALQIAPAEVSVTGDRHLPLGTIRVRTRTGGFHGAKSRLGNGASVRVLACIVGGTPSVFFVVQK